MVTLFDHLVSAHQHHLRDRDAERLRGCETDGQIALVGLLDRQIARPRPTQDPVDDERVDIADYLDMIRIYMRVILNICEPA
jgi:hypothetical protein